MGRTVMPFSHVLEMERGGWKEFRKALNKEDRETFDRLFGRAKFHTHAGVYMAHPHPMETILLSIILEHEEMKHKRQLENMYDEQILTWD